MASNVGPTRSSEAGLKPLEVATAGAVSGFVTRMVAQPFDVLKIRFQLQIESTRDPKSHYHGVVQSMGRIAKEEGVTALWRGHVSAQCLTVIFSSMQFCCYNSLAWALSSTPKVTDSPSVTVSLPMSTLSLCGSLSAVCGTVFSMPFDVARTRIVAQSNNKYRGWRDVFRQMVHQESVVSLWRGLVPTLASSAPYAALQFPVYTKLMELTYSPNGGLYYRSTISGIVSGFFAKLVVFPLDLLKKRSQMRGAELSRSSFGKVVQYSSTLDIVLQTCRQEGLTGWYKGLSPALLKSCVVSAVSFVTFEALCQAITAS